MAIERITEDELAAFVRDTGTRVVRAQGVWWAELKPCFFRPLLPFAEIWPAPLRFPVRMWLGGAQHCVPDEAPANSHKSFFVFEQPQKYDLATLGHGQPTKIRKGLKLFQWRRMDNLKQFIVEAHPVYVSFAQRTGYEFKNERTNQRHFATWARALFSHPKIVVNGAYREDRLSAVSICYLVGDTFINSTYFSDSDSLSLRVYDFVLHKLRQDAATTDARLVYMGPQTGVEGIDRAKQSRGCQLVTRRTHLWLNPVTSLALKWLKPNAYSRLWGLNPEQFPLSISSREAREVRSGAKKLGVASD